MSESKITLQSVNKTLNEAKALVGKFGIGKVVTWDQLKIYFEKNKKNSLQEIELLKISGVLTLTNTIGRFNITCDKVQIIENIAAMLTGVEELTKAIKLDIGVARKTIGTIKENEKKAKTIKVLLMDT